MEKGTALKILKELHDKSLFAERTALETLIPELKESEDERIRKWIKKELESKYVVDNIVNDVMADKAFAWLERQGEQKQEWSEEDLISLGYLATFVDENGDSFYGKNKPNVVKWIRSFANLNPTQKQEWSDFDAKMLARAMRAVNYFISNDDHDEANQCFSWLKSLKERYTWKPSEEQMEALKIARDRNDRIGFYLSQLYDDLKKLM